MLFPLSNTFSPNLQPYLILEPALSVALYNRRDCCMDRNNNSEIQILDDSGTIVATQSIEAGDFSQFTA